jgi:DnaJ-domain-containing protein 1
MQILLGVNETIIKINSKSIRIEYIQDFINTHFSDKIIDDNYIFIPQSEHNSYHRTFLLKWLYMLYAKKTKNDVLRLKESLVHRQQKPIKIILPQKIVHKITWEIINDKTIHILIVPSNYQIIHVLQKALKSKLFISASRLSIEINTEEEKKSLQKLLDSSELIKIPYLHIYNKSKMDDFLAKKKKIQNDAIDYAQAHTILGSLPDDNAKTLKKKYKQLAMQFHPDRAEQKDNHTITLYTKKFQNILQAYEILLCRVS